MGNLERVLVFGILVVIGLILIVAVNGARQVEEGYGDVAEAPAEDDTDVLSLSLPGSPGERNSGARETRNGGKPGTTPETSRREGQKPEPQRSLDSNVSEALQQVGEFWQGQDPQKRERRSPPAGEGDLQKAPDLEATALPRPGPGAGREKPAVDPRSPPVEGGNAGRTAAADRSPPEPGATTEAQAGDLVYTILAGDTLEGIARRLYAEPGMWRKIAEANDLDDPSRIRAGQRLKLPAPPVDGARSLVQRSADTAPPTAAAPDDEPGFRRIVASGTHKVERGDTLMSIAERAYGTKAAWRVILTANADQIPDKDRIRVGQNLVLPPQ